MYSPVWSPRLRQGDIVGPLFLPTLGKNFQWVTPGTSLTGTLADQKAGKVLIDGEYHLLAVVSHCCEFNEGKRNKFLVARLQSPPGNLTAEQMEALEKSNDVEARAEEKESIAGVDTFLLDPLPDYFEQPQVVVFTAITPVPMSMREDFAKSKLAELDQATRERFRSKLAWFFGRHAEDIPDEEKSLPPRPDTEAEEVDQG